MAEVSKISSFKSFSEVKAQENQMKLREENNLKKKATLTKIEEILDEMGLSSLSELDEDTATKFFAKVLEDEAEEIEDEINDLGEPKKLASKLEERNAFLGARAKAIEEDREEFEFNGKTYKVTTKSNVSEGNAFGDAVRKAKEAGEKEFEFDGKTYKVEEGNAFGDAVRKAKEAGEKEFEFDGKTYKVEEHLNEAIKVEGKRDAKKVVTQYNKIFNKSLVDFGAMSTESILGCIKYLMDAAMHDANFHREAEPTAKMIKGSIKPLEIKMPGLGGHFVKIGPKTIKEILDKYYSDIANAAGWGGIGIVEGTALYLEQIKQEAMGQAIINKFNTMFEGEMVRVDVDSKLNEAKDSEFLTLEISEAKFVKEFDKAVLDANTKDEVLKIYPDAEFWLGKSDHFFGQLQDNLFFKAYYTKGQQEFKIKTVYSEKNKSFVNLYKESVVNEAEVTSDEEFKEYAFNVLQKAFGDDFDEAKAEEIVNGILKKCGDDYGACVGTLTSSLG